MEEIIIDISPDGTGVRVEGKDIAGPDCKMLTKDIEEALGVTTHTTVKPEFHRSKQQQRTKTV